MSTYVYHQEESTSTVYRTVFFAEKLSDKCDGYFKRLKSFKNNCEKRSKKKERRGRAKIARCQCNQQLFWSAFQRLRGNFRDLRWIPRRAADFDASIRDLRFRFAVWTLRLSYWLDKHRWLRVLNGKGVYSWCLNIKHNL